MIRIHEAVKVKVIRSYRDNWIRDFNNTEAVYDFTFEYDNGHEITEQIVIPMIGVGNTNIERLAEIKNMLLDDFKEVRVSSPSESARVYLRKVAL